MVSTDHGSFDLTIYQQALPFLTLEALCFSLNTYHISLYNMAIWIYVLSPLQVYTPSMHRLCFVSLWNHTELQKIEGSKVWDNGLTMVLLSNSNIQVHKGVTSPFTSDDESCKRRWELMKILVFIHCDSSSPSLWKEGANLCYYLYPVPYIFQNAINLFKGIKLLYKHVMNIMQLIIIEYFKFSKEKYVSFLVTYINITLPVIYKNITSSSFAMRKRY